MSVPTGIMYLYDADNVLKGVVLTPELWDLVKDQVLPVCQESESQLAKGKSREVAEPLSDWEELKQCWDFKYPYSAKAQCEQCGAKTHNWDLDEPRKFRLMAANLGGLVRLKCLSCGSIITKRHFKDHIDCECKPFEGC